MHLVIISVNVAMAFHPKWKVLGCRGELFPCWSELVEYGQENFLLNLIGHVFLTEYECSGEQLLFSSLAMPWQPCAPTVISIHDPTKDDKK